jgi:peptidoglycan/LPS O-acetylase OafA/YrhL
VDWFIIAIKMCGLACGLALVALGCAWLEAPWMIYFGWLLASVCGTALITRLVVLPGGWLSRLLENRILVFVGRISYGLYVWHFPILQFMIQRGLPWQKLEYLPPVFAAALLSYYTIEKPALRLKGRFAGGKSVIYSS